MSFLDLFAPSKWNWTTPDLASIVGAGDPVMAQVALGRDYAEQVKVAEEVKAAETAKGRELTDAEFERVAVEHPGVDLSVDRTRRSVKKALTGFWDGLLKGLGVLKWVLVGLVLLVLWILGRKLYKAVAG